MTLTRMVGMVFGLVGIRIVGAGLNLLSQVIFAHIFSPTDVGVIFLCMSTTAFFGLVATVGYPWLALTLLPRFETLGLQKIQHAFHGAFLHDGFITYVVLCVLCIAATMLLGVPIENRTALLFACLGAPASVMMRAGSAVANSQRSFTLSYAPDFIVRPLLLLVYILVLIVSGIHVSMLHALVAFIVALYIVGFGQAFILGEHGPLPSDIKYSRPALTRALRPRAISLGIVAVVATSFADLVTMIAGFLLPSTDLAVLAVTVRLAAMAGFIIQVAQQFVLPDLTAALTKRDPISAQNILLRLNLITIATIIGALLGTLIFGRFALSVFGKTYEVGQPLLIALMIGQSIRAFSGMNQQLLSIAGHQAKTAGASIAAFLALVVVASLAAPSNGMMGIGFAVIVAELIWSLILAVQSQRYTGGRGDIFWLLSAKKKTDAL
jgi:O-antigen/teichoic acid export membrane protein